MEINRYIRQCAKWIFRSMPICVLEPRVVPARRRPIHRLGKYRLSPERPSPSRPNILAARDILTGKQVFIKYVLPGQDIGLIGDIETEGEDKAGSRTRLAERAFYDNEFNVARDLEHESFAKPVEKGVAVKYYCKGIVPTRYKIQYYVYEFVEGKSLHKYYPIPSRDQYSQELTLDMKLWVAAKLTEALRLLHAKGKVFLDLNPGNVMVCPRNPFSVGLSELGVTLVDFETTVTAGEPHPAGKEYKMGKYSPAYAPVEQILQFEQFTQETDHYALCGILFELFTYKKYNLEVSKRGKFELDLFEFADAIPLSLIPHLQNGLRHYRENRELDLEVLRDCCLSLISHPALWQKESDCCNSHDNRVRLVKEE
ncbi:MAG: protein kinase, partial [Gemmatimonadetes bacterium]|nr:protein kinase [Gemmatimonadota bacterium]